MRFSSERLSTTWLSLAAGALIVLMTLAAYIPAMRGGFVWDDDKYVTENPLLTASDGLKQIWFSLDSPSQYFPLVYTTFRMERALWGLDPLGYHLVNIFLHAINALLVWRLLRRLSVPGAWFASAIFALHPVHVESVAWITERKNVLSTVFYLSALLAWVRFTARSASSPWRYYLLAIVLYALALFSKTTACTLPAALLLVLWIGGERIGWRRLAQVVPFVILGAAMGALSIWWERHHQGTTGPEFAFTQVERILIASRALWFYVGKLVWPTGLTFSYPRWRIDTGDPVQYGWLIACLCAVIALWRWRASARGPVAATIFFAAALAPMLGFVSLYTFRYSFVADHYQYVASIGLIALFAAAVTREWRAPAAGYGMRFALPLIVLVALGILTWRQGCAYKDPEALWSDTLAKNPLSWMAHDGLGVALVEQGRVEEAIAHYAEALRIEPHHVEAHLNWGVALSEQGKLEEAIEHFQRALEINPRHPDIHYNLGICLAAQGRVEQAIAHYSEALQVNPAFAAAHNNLANLLYARGKLTEAIQHYSEALRINPANAAAHNNLGNVLAMQGKLDEAVARYRAALRIDPEFAEAHYALGSALARQGNTDQAARERREAVRLKPELARDLVSKPDPASEHFNRGVSLDVEGRIDEAIREYQEAIRLRPDYAGAHVNLGLALKNQGKTDAAIREYREAIRIKPDLAEAHNNLAIALYFKGDYAEAWREVYLCRKHGVSPHPDFLKALSEKMPEPVE